MADLSGLKVGDPVVICTAGYGDAPDKMERSEVVEVTKGGNYKLKGSTAVWNTKGNYRGQDPYSRMYFDRFNQEIWDGNVKQWREVRDRFRLKNLDFGKLPIETVRKMLKVLGEESL